MNMTADLLWSFVRWATGVRLYHVVALALALLALLLGLALPFWWIGERADAVVGVAGWLMAAAAYALTATAIVVFAAIRVGRTVLLRLRRSLTRLAT